jgi:hypothetical protein
MDLNNASVVTGGSSGGYATAKLLIDRGKSYLPQ